ncbi:MAG: glutamate--cysteine ligase, partial [Neisseriaceae bacterium]|nr:glutamate--cysteine ligase [Neisseriaceae bacterium]
MNQEPYLSLLGEGLRGIERETLRINANGQLNTEPHPLSLGSALTHPFITTDYSESLLEFITPAVSSPDLAIQKLQETHHYAYSQLGDKRLWSASKPSNLPSEADI